MSDKRTKPCGAESCCYMDDKKHFTDLLEALKDLLDSEWQDDDGTPRLEAARDKARALIAKHGPKKHEEKPTKYDDEFMPRYSRDDEDWFFHPNDD